MPTEDLRLRRIVSRALVVAALVFVGAAAGCGGDDEGDDGGARTEAGATLDPGDFSSDVDHRFFPLASVGKTTYEGSEKDPDTGETIETRVESRVLDETDVIAGVEATVVDVKEYEDDELVEHTLDYYAQRSDGAVLYLGEKVDNYEDGKIKDHEGQWYAGQGNAKPGLFLPPDPKVGDEFEQERAPGVAEDRSTVVELGVKVKTPAGEFTDCMKTKDVSPLSGGSEFKFYCPDVGLVREEAKAGEANLVEYSKT
jgi:hypothetical protein